MVGTKTVLLVVTALFTLGAAAAPPPADAPKYLDFATFKALAALVPGIPRPRIVGLTEDGQTLWAQGQLRLPAVGHFAQGDFTRSGTQDAALLFEDGDRRYLLVAGRSGGGWFRKALFALQGQSGVIWDGEVIRVGPPETFVEWTGKQFRLTGGPLAGYAYNYSTDDFSGVMLKLTYIGPQMEPYPGLLIFSYYRWADPDAFKPYRRPGVHYGNDDLRLLWHLTIDPERLRALVLTVKNVDGIDRAAARTGQEPGLSHSLSIVDIWSAHRPNAFEALLTLDETASLTHTAARSIERQDPAAAQVMLKYLAMFGR